MPNSFAQTIELPCPQCGKPFTADIWQIVDVTERPDLLEQLQTATLHDLPCPHCGTVYTLDVPLLVYQPDDAPHLTFSPAQGASDEEALQQSSNLLEMLFQTLGSAWQDGWLAQMPIVRRPILATTLKKNTGDILPHTELPLFGIIVLFISAENGIKLQRFIEEHPELMDDEADVLLAELADADIVKERRALLRRCREVGIDQAFAERISLAGQVSLPVELQADLRQAKASEAHYLRTSNQAELDNALAAWQRILNHPVLAKLLSTVRLAILNDAGNSFLRRYWARGRTVDLDQALRLWTEAVAQTAIDAPDRPMYLNNLGNGLSNRYARTGRLEDLEQAIAAFQQAVTQTASNAPNRPMYLNNLGTGLSYRYARTGWLEDLEQAITAFQQAVTQTAIDAPDRPMYLNNLGNGLSNRYARTGRLEDLEQAIAAYQQAVTLTATDAPDRPSRLNNLGTGLSNRYARTERLEDLEQGINRYRQACEQGLIVAPEAALHSARNWGGWAVARGAWAEASAAYAYGLTAIDQLFAVQLVRRDQESALSLCRGFHARAAYALARNGDLATAAITLERGRARLLAESLERNRADLLLLPTHGRSDLYQRYRDAIEQKQSLLQPTEPSATAAGFHLTGLTRLQALEAAQREIDETITAIQKIPGYEDFFAQPTIAQLQVTAQVAPLVYLLTTEAGGLALIVQADKLTPVWLDGFTEEKLREHLNAWFGAYSQQRTARQAWLDMMENITRALWDEVMGPVAAALRDLTTPSTRSVTLIPTGLLSLLPFHAAWTDNVTGTSEMPVLSRRYFLDEYALAYAPSATALRHAQARAQTAAVDHLLAIDEPRPVRGNALPNSAREVAAVADHFVQPQILAHLTATRQAALAALAGDLFTGGVDVAHFSCHGGNDWQNPLESGLLMAHDEMLTVRDLLELQLPGARLATLSACETGIVGTTLPDEVVALPSALVQAGFAGVVASLWSVADISTAMLMARFYDFWQKDKMQPAQALRAAQRWVRDTTNREKADHFDQAMLDASSATRMPEIVAADFFSAVMIHKEGQDARSFAHPFWWAAFYLTGV